jgi:hypothetical protein
MGRSVALRPGAHHRQLVILIRVGVGLLTGGRHPAAKEKTMKTIALLALFGMAQPSKPQLPPPAPQPCHEVCDHSGSSRSAAPTLYPASSYPATCSAHAPIGAAVRPEPDRLRVGLLPDPEGDHHVLVRRRRAAQHRGHQLERYAEQGGAADLAGVRVGVRVSLPVSAPELSVTVIGVVLVVPPIVLSTVRRSRWFRRRASR